MSAQYATPGPWEIKKDDDQWRIRQKGTVKRGPGYTLERPVGEGFNYKLDAQLAASAPDLLEALEAALDGVENNHPLDADITSWQEAARAAIARAKGEPLNPA